MTADRRAYYETTLRRDAKWRAAKNSRRKVALTAIALILSLWSLVDMLPK